MTIPEEDADVGQGSKYCLVAIGRLQVMPVFPYVNYFWKLNQCYGLGVKDLHEGLVLDYNF